MRDSITIGLVGAGGDGVVTIGEIILAVVQTEDFYGRLNKYYGAQIRGGGSAVKVSIAKDKNKFPDDNLDILICLSAEKFLEFKEELPLSDTALFLTEESVPFGQISKENTGDSRNKNIVVLGLLLGSLGFDKRVATKIKERNRILTKQNQSALEAGIGEALRIIGRQFSIVESPSGESSSKILIVDGNRAISLGAIRAGCGFAAAYPITPASDIGEYLSEKLPQDGKTYLQAEDEIAAACMVLGASLAGAKAMTATSGPGFDLMAETINLASSAEIPMVIVDVQRAGPSTGMATKTEQSDLSSAIFSGHGYAPRVVLAPYNLEDCYRLTIEAFDIAEKYQVPVILLSDQYLGQTLQIVDDFVVEHCSVEDRLLPSGEKKNKYLRYEINSSFISPMAVPGADGFMWRATGLTHDEKGNPAESLEWQKKMQEKITRKLDSLRDRRDLVKMFGSANSRTGLISWGSSAEVSLAAIKKLGLEEKIRVCVPELISPMPTEIMREFLCGLRKLFIVEMNYSGQYYGFLRRYFNLPRRTFLCKRPGGRPWSQLEIINFIKEAGR